MEKPEVVEIGRSQVELKKIVRDPRGIEDMIAEIVGKDWSENRFRQFDMKLTPFADAADIAEWDETLLRRYPPLYADSETACCDCQYGPCDLGKGVGRCGLELEPFRARLTLQAACRGCLTQMEDSRQLLDFAVKAFGGDKSTDLGPLLYMGDYAPSLGILTGIYARTLDDLDRALSYAEGQLAKLLAASRYAAGTVADIEGMVLHAGSMCYLAMDVSEIVKMTCFGFANAAQQRMDDLIDYPTVSTVGGLGSIEAGKPVLAFAGDDFLPAWAAISRIKENGLRDKIEVCGIGPVADDMARFYDNCRVLAPMTQAAKVVRSGFADVLVASRSCMHLDLAGEAKRVDTRFIWTGRNGLAGLRDRSDDPVDDIVKELVAGGDGVAIRDVEKAGEVAVKVAIQGVKRQASYIMSEAKVRKEAARCLPDCDLCFSVCPNSLPVSKAMVAAQKEGARAMLQVERGCYFCGKCEAACPAGIPIRDLIVAAQAKRAPEDKFVMRAGRGPAPDCEQRAMTFALIYGNSPGVVFIQGCGDSGDRGDLGWIAHELVSRNCLVMTAGCAAAEIGRYQDEATGQSIYQKFGAEYQAQMLINCGGCSANVQLMDLSYRAARLAAFISHYANYAETADYNYQRICQLAIIWGALPERMFTLAAGWARNGVPVIVGPASGFSFRRWLVGNKYDRSVWFMYDGFDGRKRDVEPAPKHLIIPVETKEEVVTLAGYLFARSTELREMRQADIETYVDLYQTHFGELPDDWHLLVRTDAELPARTKVKLLRVLRDQHGWEIERVRIKRARHPDGRLLTVPEYVHQYSLEQGHYATCLYRLVTKGGKEGAKA